MSEDKTMPSGWCDVRLEDLVLNPKSDLVDGPFGSNLKSSEYIDSGIPVLKIQNIKANRFVRKRLSYVSPKKAAELSRHSFVAGDLMITKLGEPLGLCCEVPADLEHGVFVADLMRLRPSPKIVKSAFLLHSINSVVVQSQFKEITKGTTRQRVNLSIVRGIKLALPPLAEQKRIIEKLEELFSELDAGAANLKKARAQLAVYRQALLKHAFEGKLTAEWRAKHAAKLESADMLLSRISAEMTDNNRNTEQNISSTSFGWLELSLANITKDSLIGLVRAADLQNQEGRGFCYIKMDRVDMSGHVDIEPKVFVDCSKEEAERFALRQGDILFNTRNSVELVGKTGLIRKSPQGLTVFNNNLMRIRIVSPVLASFLNHQMCAPDFRNAMEHVKKATTSVAAVYGKDLWPLRLVIPSTREQQRIVDELDSQLDAVESLEADIDLNLQKAEALRQSILKKAFAGELVPQDPADEPAAVLLARIRAEREAQAADPKLPKTRTKKA